MEYILSKISNNPVETTHSGPQLCFLTQPQKRYRFRYASETISHGCLHGNIESKHNCNEKSYPTVQLKNYDQPARLRCELVEDREPHVKHRHILIVDQDKDIAVDVEPKNSVVCWSNMSVIYRPKKEIVEEIMAEMKELGCRKDDKNLKKCAESRVKQINLNIVRLKVTAYDVKTGTKICEAISDPIHNMKSPETNELKIVKISKTRGVVQGFDEIFILCEKVKKDDIKVEFYEWDDFGEEIIWQVFAKIAYFHRQFAIVIETPRYPDDKLCVNKKVNIRLFRPSDQATSVSVPFEYKAELAYMPRKRKMTATSSSADTNSESAASPYSILTHDMLMDTGYSQNDLLGEALENELICADDPVLPFNSLTLGEVDTMDSSEIRELIKDGVNSEEYRNFIQEFNVSEESKNWLGVYGEEIGTLDDDICDLTAIDDHLLNKLAIGKITTDGSGNSNILRTRLLQGKEETKSSANYAKIPGKFNKKDALKIKEIFSKIKEKKAGKDDLENLIQIKSAEGLNLLHLSVINDMYPTLECLAKLAKRVHREEVLDFATIDGETPLQLAIRCDRSQHIKLLGKCGADPGTQDKDGNNALHLAVIRKRHLDLLLSHDGAVWALNDTNNEGYTPLQLACRSGQKEAAKSLIKRGANPAVAPPVGSEELLNTIHDLLSEEAQSTTAGFLRPDQFEIKTERLKTEDIAEEEFETASEESDDGC